MHFNRKTWNILKNIYIKGFVKKIDFIMLYKEEKTQLPRTFIYNYRYDNYRHNYLHTGKKIKKRNFPFHYYSTFNFIETKTMSRPKRKKRK